jgi:hypothetical protein
MVGAAGLAIAQMADPSGLIELPGLVRGPLAFLAVLAFGAAVLWRFDGVVDRSIDASIERPLSSLAYGIGAHATLAFAGVYLTSQFTQLTLSGRSLGPIGIWLGFVLLAFAAGLGFTVVGSAVLELRWDRPRWYGLVVGALIAGFAGLVTPLVGGLIWLIIVSTGIGGPVRSWIHASEDVSV